MRTHMMGRVFEILPAGEEVIVRDYITDDSGGEYDVHETRFYSKDRAIEYLKNLGRAELFDGEEEPEE